MKVQMKYIDMFSSAYGGLVYGDGEIQHLTLIFKEDWMWVVAVMWISLYQFRFCRMVLAIKLTF